jgi:DNA-binding FadR family transcriptional regulator
MARYAASNATEEDVSRIHNGGCNILKKKGSKAWDNTTKYWEKVKKELEKK